MLVDVTCSAAGWNGYCHIGQKTHINIPPEVHRVAPGLYYVACWRLEWRRSTCEWNEPLGKRCCSQAGGQNLGAIQVEFMDQAMILSKSWPLNLPTENSFPFLKNQNNVLKSSKKAKGNCRVRCYFYVDFWLNTSFTSYRIIWSVVTINTCWQKRL